MSHSTVITIVTNNSQTLKIETGSRKVSEMFGVKVLENKKIVNEDAQEALQRIIHQGQVGYDNIALISMLLTMSYSDVSNRRTALDKKERGDIPEYGFISEWDVNTEFVPDALLVIIKHYD